MRPTPLLRNLLRSPLSPTTPFSSHNTPTYSLGLSYASKSSPPFVPPQTPPPRYGFAGTRLRHTGEETKVGKWVERALTQRAGRGQLDAGVAGGWDEGLGEECRKWGAGEDFFCIVNKGRAEGDGPRPIEEQNLHLAVSDGVGGWGDIVDPSFFSQGLMYHYALSADPLDRQRLGPLEHLQKAYKGLMEDELITAGGATACTLILGGDGIMRGVNLGDSGCLVLRGGETVFTARSLTHYFNCPYQMAKTPKGSRNAQSDSPERPGCYETFEHPLLPGDVVLLYTDGFADNVPPSHIPLLVSRIDTLLASPSNAHLSYEDRNDEKARLVADVLVGYGRAGMQRTGMEAGWKTPFEVEAGRHGANFKGGKVDDITIIAAVVGERYPEDDLPNAKL